MTTAQGICTVAAVTAATLLTRFLPFWLFPENKKTPRFVTDLGTMLPYAVMALLVVYCLKNVTLFAAPYGLPELLGVGVTAGLHLAKRNTLLSIAGGTAAYMLLVQCVFL